MLPNNRCSLSEMRLRPVWYRASPRTVALSNQLMNSVSLPLTWCKSGSTAISLHGTSRAHPFINCTSRMRIHGAALTCELAISSSHSRIWLVRRSRRWLRPALKAKLTMSEVSSAFPHASFSASIKSVAKTTPKALGTCFGQSGSL